MFFRVIDRGYSFYIGDGNNLMYYTFVDDLVRSTVLLEKSKIVNENFIAVAGRPARQDDIVKKV